MKRLLVITSFVMFALFLAQSCGNSPEMTESEKNAYMDKGKEAVTNAAGLLSSNLGKAIADSGIVYAIQFCQINAEGLTDSASSISGYPIARRALKQRNPGNKPNTMETQVLKMYDRAAEQGKELKPTLLQDDHGAVFYFHPIVIQPLCLNCHGKIGEHITEETFNALKAAYPKDRAFNYALGDFRGMWTVALK